MSSTHRPRSFVSSASSADQMDLLPPFQIVNPAIRQISPQRDLQRPSSPLFAPIPLNYTLDPKSPLVPAFQYQHRHLHSNNTPLPPSPPAGTISRELTTTPSSSSSSGKGRYVRIVEVSPRDGLQNLPPPAVETTLKKELVERLLDAGVRNVEVGSFVRGDWVPQMADTPQLLPLLPPLTSRQLPLPTLSPSPMTARSSSPFTGRPTTPSVTPHTSSSLPPEAHEVHYPVLVPNMRGLEILLELEEEWKGLEEGRGRLTDEIAVFVSATEAFSMANNHAPIYKVLSSLPAVISKAQSHKLRTRGYVSCVITCPYSGATDPDAVIDVVERLLNMGCYEVSLGDTTGEGDPESWRVLWERGKMRGVDMDKIACHDTFSMALSSILSLLPLGIRTIDSSLAGLGGCPYSPGATGNVPTEDAVYALHKLGYETGIDLDRLVESGNWLSEKLGVRNESRVGRAIWARKAKRESDMGGSRRREGEMRTNGPLKAQGGAETEDGS
ncbi:hypothetical protein IAR55_000741 [Kwoniella newhampshirensis]|uniref:hydroxymethylglutaryl-CoA lyase n=1 Tax=Kwoniella newhampshirensis TaxID=1651941 RepID=A0AAW0Z3Q6_9TREE